MIWNLARLAICTVALAIVRLDAASAQSSPQYIAFPGQPGATKGALYTPDSGPAPHVAILATHRTANYLSYHGCRELAARGYLVLCMNPRSDNNEAAVRWEENALDVKAGIELLRARPGIRSVLLWGFSGGGATTSFYQAVAEIGVEYCRGPNKLVECGDELAGLPKADGLILVDSNYGVAAGAVMRLNGAVVNDAEIIGENERPVLDASLDPFDPKNGFNPDGASNYSDDFKERYFKAQAARMNRLIELARARLAEIERGAGSHPDDDAFIIPRADSAELLRTDPSIHHTTAKPRKLLKNDGTVVTQIVESVRLPEPQLARADKSFRAGTLFLTLRSFLSANAMRATHSIDGLDYCSSNNSVPCAVQSISVPLLISAMGANRYLRFSETHYELAKSEDKDFIIVEGATHPQLPCVPCERTPGQFANATRNFFDYVKAWIDDRY